MLPLKNSTINGMLLFIMLSGSSILLGCASRPPPSRKTVAPDDKIMVLVPAGDFRMGLSAKQQSDLANRIGVSPASLKDESPQTNISLSEFYIDQTPVTNSEYKKFLDAHPEHAVPYVEDPLVRAFNWDKSTRTFPAQFDRLPVVLVTWPDSAAFCAWAGKRLPTEAEWEKAARGTDERLWPWGNDWDVSKVSSGRPTAGRLPAVGQSPASASPFGALDMVGIIWQWTSTLEKPYPYDLRDGREDPNAPGRRITRGGALGLPAAVSRATTRNPFDPAGVSLAIGFRCAMSSGR